MVRRPPFSRPSFVSGEVNKAVLKRTLRAVFSFPVALASLLAAWVYLLSNGTIEDPDIWWHLFNARYLLTHHQLPRVDMLSYTVAGQPWLNHEWLAEIPFYLAWRRWGLAGINAVQILLVEIILLGVFWLAYRSSRNLKASWLVSCFATLLATVSFGPRTLLFGYVYLVALLLILERFRSQNRGPLWAIPPLFVLWVNCHGSWLIGMAVFGIIIAAGLVDFPWPGVEVVKWSPRQVRQLLVTAGASIAAVFVNPFGYRLVSYPFELALHQKLMVSHTEEWASVDFHNPRGKSALLLFLMLLLGALLSRYRWKLEELALAAVGLYLGLMHVRFMFLAAILVVPLIAKFLDFVPPYRPEIDKPLLNAAIVAIVAVIIFTRIPSAGRLEDGVDDQYPAQALGFTESHQLPGNGFNYYGWGGYLSWKDAGVKTFVDSRNDVFEHAGVLAEYLDVSGVKEPLKVLDKYQVGWVLFPTKDAFAYFLAHTEGWKVIYSDRVAEVFERSGPLPPPPTAKASGTVAAARQSP